MPAYWLRTSCSRRSIRPHGASICPVAERCAWRAAGHPAYDGPPRRAQAWAGTDRQCRGRLMAVLREADGPVHTGRLEAAWPGDPDQRDRCLEGLARDGLAVRTGPATWSLPS